MAATIKGPWDWSLSINDKGVREYTLTQFVVTDSPEDGPHVVWDTPGIPQPGETWDFDNDFDEWAQCKHTKKIKRQGVKEGEPGIWWLVESTFSTEPDTRCQDDKIEDPLLLPPKISGGFQKYTKEGVYDRFGNPIITPSFEFLHGPTNEWDQNRPTVKIEQNVVDLQLPLLAQMQDTLNDDVLWDLPARMIKLSNISWERKFYGQCYVYFTRTLEFDVNFETFDRDVLDEGTKVLQGRWQNTGEPNGWYLKPTGLGADPVPTDPEAFNKMTDHDGNPIKAVMTTDGLPLGADIYSHTGSLIPGYTANKNNPGNTHVEFYQESNFLLLGIPLTLAH